MQGPAVRERRRQWTHTDGTNSTDGFMTDTAGPSGTAIRPVARVDGDRWLRAARAS